MISCIMWTYMVVQVVSFFATKQFFIELPVFFIEYVACKMLANVLNRCDIEKQNNTAFFLNNENLKEIL